MTTNPVPNILADLPFIYCEGCKAVRPYEFDVLKANKLNPHDAADFVCTYCKLIVATLHAAIPKKKRKARK